MLELLHGLWGYAVPFVVVLTVLVFVHEMGHFLVARRNGVRVEVFSIGFGPELFGWNDRRGTRWKFSSIPLGGYVKLFGEQPEALGSLTPAEQAVAFSGKSLGQRAAIVFAGPAFNFLFAMVVLALLYGLVGKPYTLPVVGGVQPDSAAAAAGIRPGDVILGIGGHQVAHFEDIPPLVQGHPGQALKIEIQRGEDTLVIVATPRLKVVTDNFGHQHRIGLLGISASRIGFERQNMAAAAWEAAKATVGISGQILHSVGQMIVGERGAGELGGPLRIAEMSGQVARGGPLDLVVFMAMLSINLGLINLFPVPLLDGGHLLFYGIEAIRGRPLGLRAQEFGFRIGVVLVLSLLLFATWNDLVHLKVWDFLKGLLG